MSDTFSFDVMTSPHDDVKTGKLVTRHSRVTISRDAFPDFHDAYATAACLAVAIHGGMPTSVHPRF